MNLTRVIGQLARADRHEWSIRGSQFLSSRATELLAFLRMPRFRRNGHLQSLGIPDSELPSWFRGQSDSWFCSERKRHEISRVYDRNPQHRQRLIQRADAILDGKMPILGHGFVEYSGELRWHRDTILGVVAPHRTYTRIRYLDVEQVGDSKHVWEPNRFGWAYWLGAAYLLTGDDSYARAFSLLTLDWFDRNRYPFGINYCSALEVALRNYAWVWAVDLFRSHLHDNPQLLDRLLRGVWQGCRHVENNLSHYFAPNTHLIGEAFGLYACGAAFPQFTEAIRWREKGAAILAEEAGKQLHLDGTHRELSSCYHLYTTDFYVQASLIAKQTGFPLDNRVHAAAIALSNRLGDLTPGDGLLPQFNDCDGGRLTWFCGQSLDALPSLEAARHLSNAVKAPPSDRFACGYNLWMDTPAARSGEEPRASPPVGGVGRELAKVYDSGIVTYRNSSGDYILFRSGPFGYKDCGHSHDAPTGFVLYFAKQPLIVDSGVGHYSQSLATRDAYRSARGKNILLLGGSGPSVPCGWFSWKRTTDATLLSARRMEGGFFCAGKHEGFTQLAGFPVAVSRSITLLDDGVAVVVDRWRAKHEIEPSNCVTLDPHISSDSEGLLSGADGSLSVHYLAQQVDASAAERAHELAVSSESIDYSPSYGITSKTGALSFTCTPSQAGASVMIFSRAGAISPTERSEEFHLDRHGLSATIRVDFEAENPARLTIRQAKSTARQSTRNGSH